MVHTEHNCLCKAIGAFKKVSKVTGDGCCAGPERNNALKIYRLIFVVRNRPTISIELVTSWTPAPCICARYNAMNAVRREESVFNSLPQAVSESGLPKVIICIALFFAKWCGGHPEMDG